MASRHFAAPLPRAIIKLIWSKINLVTACNRDFQRILSTETDKDNCSSLVLLELIRKNPEGLQNAFAIGRTLRTSRNIKWMQKQNYQPASWTFSFSHLAVSRSRHSCGTKSRYLGFYIFSFVTTLALGSRAPMAHLHFLEPIPPILNEKVGFQAYMQGHQNKSSTYFHTYKGRWESSTSKYPPPTFL